MYFDTHAHYDSDAFDGDRDALVSSLPGRGVGLVVDPGCDGESSLAAVALSGCSLVVKDDAVDAKRVIIDVNGQTLNKETVNAQVDNQLAQMASYYSSYYGYTIDTTSESVRSSAIDDVIDSDIKALVKQLFIHQKIFLLGPGCGSNRYGLLVSQCAQHAHRLLTDGLHAAQNRGFLV